MFLPIYIKQFLAISLLSPIFLASTLVCMEEDPDLLAALQASQVSWQREQKRKSSVEAQILATHRQLLDLINDVAATPSESSQLAKEFLVELAHMLEKNPAIRETLEKAQHRVASITNFLLEHPDATIVTALYGEITLKQFADFALQPVRKELGRVLTLAASKSAIPLHVTTPKGLTNPNCRCFMHAAIQCLYALSTLNNRLSTAKNCTGITQSYIKLSNTIDKASPTSIIDAKEFCSQGWQLLGTPLGSSQDAREFTQELLNSMRSSSDISSLILTEFTAGLFYNSPEFKHFSKLEQLLLLFPAVKQLFEKYPELNQLNSIGAFAQQYDSIEKIADHFPELATLINTNSDLMLFLTSQEMRSQKHSTVTLPITSSNTLEKCLANLFTIKKIGSNHELYYTAQLTNVGNYFIIGLDRTSHSSLTGNLFKNEKPITFPVYNLDLSSYADRPLTHNKYELVSFIVHIGDPLNGHYTAYVKHGNQWSYCNDASVTQISSGEIEAIAQRGYGIDKHHTPVMFFYAAE